MTRRDSYDEQLDDAELAELYPRHVPRCVPPAARYRLARMTASGPEPYDFRPLQTLDVCRRAIEALMSDPASERDMALVVVDAWVRDLRDAEVVIEAWDVVRELEDAK